MLESLLCSLTLFFQQAHFDTSTVHFHTLKPIAHGSTFLVCSFQEPPHKNVENGVPCVKEVQRCLKSPSTILLIGFPKFTWQINQGFKCPTTILLCKYLLTSSSVHTNIHVILTPVLPNFISRRRKTFYKHEVRRCSPKAELCSECFSEPSVSAANLLSSSSRLCLSNRFSKLTVSVAQFPSIFFLPEDSNCLPEYPQKSPQTDLSLRLTAFCSCCEHLNHTLVVLKICWTNPFFTIRAQSGAPM